MDPLGFPYSATPARRPRRVTRRAVLGAGLLVAGGAAGVGAYEARRVADPAVPPPPQLLSAAARERELIARLAVTTGSAAAVALRDHREHLTALEAALGRYPLPTATSSATATGSPGPAPTPAQLRDFETTAATSAAAESLLLSGDEAALLASISACEATHVELWR